MSISVNFIDLANQPLRDSLQTENQKNEQKRNHALNTDNFSDIDDDNQSYSLSDIGSLTQIFATSKKVKFFNGDDSHTKTEYQRLSGHEDADPYIDDLDDVSSSISTDNSNKIGVQDTADGNVHGSASGSNDAASTIDVVSLTKSARECCGFTTFVIIFMTLVIMTRSFTTDMFHATTSMRQTLVDYPRIADGSLWETGAFEDITQVDQIWDYLENSLIPSILSETDYNGNAITDPEDMHLVGGQLKLIGGIKLRIQNSQQTTCKYLNVRIKCFDHTTLNTNDISLTNGNTIQFKTASQNDEIETWTGRVNEYTGAGNVLQIPADLTQAQQIIQELRNSQIITRATRLLVIDFNSFAVSNGLHTVSRLAFEFPDSGGIVPVSEINTWRFLKYEGDRGIAFIAIEAVFVFCVIFITYSELGEIYSDGFREYLQDGWNYLDLINISLFWVSIALRIVFAIDYNHADWLAVKAGNVEYVPLFNIQRQILNLTYIEMVSSFLLVLKFFKYFQHSPKLSFLLKIFNYSKGDLFVFLVVLGVFVIAFGISAFLLFSADVQDFNTFGGSIFSLIRFLVSEMDIDSLTSVNPVVGSLFFCLWGVMMILILSNVFIAIISAAYEEVAEELKGENLGFLSATRALASSMKISHAFQHKRNMKIVSLILKDIKVEELNPDQNNEVTIESILNHPKCAEYRETHKISETAVKDILTKIIDKNGNGLISTHEIMTFQAAISEDNATDQLSNNPEASQNNGKLIEGARNHTRISAQKVDLSEFRNMTL